MWTRHSDASWIDHSPDESIRAEDTGGQAASGTMAASQSVEFIQFTVNDRNMLGVAYWTWVCYWNVLIWDVSGKDTPFNVEYLVVCVVGSSCGVKTLL